MSEFSSVSDMSRILRSCVTSSISEWKLESKIFLQEAVVLALFSNFKGVDVLTDGESFNFFENGDSAVCMHGSLLFR